MSILQADIAAFERMLPELRSRHDQAWAVVSKGELFGTFEDFEAAATAAVDRLGAGPYLIRQIGGPPAVQLPGGMVFTPSHALSSGRL